MLWSIRQFLQTSISGPLIRRVSPELAEIAENKKFADNDKVPFEEAKLEVPLKATPWPVGRAERVGVNSYGIGGANAHVSGVM